MATLTLTGKFNYGTIPSSVGDVNNTGVVPWSTHTATTAAITKTGTAGESLYSTFEGTGFLYNSTFITLRGGTVNSFNLTVNGTQYLSVTGLASTTSSIATAYVSGYSVDGVVMSGAQGVVASWLAGNDFIRGSALADVIAGFSGNDQIYGNAGNDRLEGWSGNDTISGGTGNDFMFGGAGSDVYNVDSTSDRVFETAGLTTTSTTDAGGTDLVVSSVTLSLDAYAGIRFVEKLTLTGSTAINGTGNALANTITGNNGANILHGNASNDVLVGGIGADTLYGDANNDLLRGGVGNDILWGGSGSDSFRFDTALSTTTLANLDQIKDFNPVEDTIQLENSIFTKFGTATTGTINSDFFKSISTGGATDANDYIVYNKTTGELFYDTNGSAAGGSVKIALLGMNLNLTAADFVLV